MRSPHAGQATAFLRAFLRFAGRGTLPTAIVVVAGGVVEGIGLALLVPVLAVLVPGGQVAPAGSGHWRAALTRTVPADWLLPVVLAAFCAVVAVRGVVLIGRDRRVDRLAFGFADAQRHRVVAALAHASWPELTALRHSRVTHVLSGEVASVATAAHLLPQIVVATVMIAVQFAVLVLVSPTLAAIALVLALAGALALARAARSAAAVGSAGVRSGFQVADQIAALLGGLKFAAAHGLRRELADRAAAEVSALTDRVVAQRRRTSRGSVIATSAAAITGVALIAVGTAVGVSTVALLAGLAILLRMSGPLRVLQSSVPQFSSLMPAFAAVSDLCDRLEDAAEPDRTAAEPDAFAGPIEARDLHFSHPGGDRPVLVAAALALAPAEFVGLAGPSGIGKTTLLDLVAGLRAPDAGAIAVGGQVLDAGRLPEWRRRLAYVTQDTFLFDGSLRDNLTWGSADAGEAALWDALAAVGLTGLVRGLPEGLETRVGERGLRFSGGQRQRFALARAILRAPRLLLLDEATSALDLEAEAAVLRAVRRALPDAAMMLVSHRAEALAVCDRVVTLVEGRLVEEPRS